VLYKAASTAAYRGKMIALSNEARDNAKNIDVTRVEAEKLKAHLKTLKDKPDDPAANLAVGRFLCFFKGDWKTGLAHLAKGSDEKLVAAATAETAASKGTETEQFAAAELWYDLAPTAEASTKSAIRGRAHFWYSNAATTLTGLAKVKALKRADELKADADARTMDWKFWAAMRQAAKDKQTKKWPLVGGAFSRVEFEDTPENGGILIGFRYTTTRGGEFPKSIQSIFLTARGEVLGKAFGVAEKGAVIQITKAKPGYAIGSLYSRGGGGLDAIKPIYMRIEGTSLDTKDTYDGPYIGGKGGGEGTSGGTGDLIIGIHGKSTADFQLGALSLVSLEGAVAPNPKK
ncbi:MAG: hypothetical protein K8U57_40815, partial [Planctomycetes bacterium]|nr:hypothetical protein [Planctomycetota bacterium]